MPTNETTSFMVRFTQKIFEDKTGNKDVQWRGRISHIQGGDQQTFTDFHDALTFMQDHLAEMTIKNTEHVAPEEQDGILSKSFEPLATMKEIDTWRSATKSDFKNVMDELSRVSRQVADLNKKVDKLGKSKK